jgi:ring-1,2-phenylacetyl-CoA epoxidase subunit PaaD
MVHPISQDEEKIYAVLKTIDDPELPISIVDLGIVKKVSVGKEVEVILVPTFSGCPALEYMEQQVRDLLEQASNGMPVNVKWEIGGHWSVDRISPLGKESLRKYGISIAKGNMVHCPYCESGHNVKESSFGPSLCREIYYCKHCKNPFEKMRTLSKATCN